MIAAGILILAGGASVLAQDATPEAESLFAGLGLPERTVSATNESLELSQSEVPAAR